MFVRGTGIRDIAEIENISIKKMLSVLVRSRHMIRPKQPYYDCLEADEFWTYVGKKSNKVWLIYACHRNSGKIVAFVWGKWDLKTARELKKKLSDSGVNYGSIATDDWDSFVSAFKGENHLTGKKHTVRTEGYNCRLRHRILRAFRKTCCFSKKLFNSSCYLLLYNLSKVYAQMNIISLINPPILSNSMNLLRHIFSYIGNSSFNPLSVNRYKIPPPPAVIY
jgi:IS1 family transposase